MKLRKTEKQPETLRDISNLSTGQKRLGLVSICALALLLGLICGAIVWAVLKIMNLGISAIWTWLPEALGCSHSLPYYLIVCLTGGLIIGLVQRQVGPLPDDIEHVLGRVKMTGGYPYDRLHIIVICALLPLLFGGALGPEAGLSGLVAGLCCWVGDRLKCKGDQLAALTETGIAAALGVIFHAPLFGIAHNLEPDDPSEHYRTKIVSKKTRIVIYCFGVLGAMLAFGLLGHILEYFTGGMAEGGLPRFNAQHAIGLDQWMWFIPLLAIGIVFSMFYQLVERITRRLGGMLSGAGKNKGTGAGAAAGAGKSWRTVIAALIPGLFMALCGYFLPLTMFSGEHQLGELIDGWQAAAPQELILSAILKLALVSLCINFGWRGGSIFPIIFSGACLGYAFALIVGMDGAFAAAIVIAALYAYQMRKPVAVITILLLCFPVTYILPVGIAAFAAAKIPSPFAQKPKKQKQD